MELTLTGRILTAREALEIGLVEFVVPHEKLLDEAFQLAGRIAQGPRISVREAKRLMKSYWDSNKTDAGFKDELDTVLEITRTPDCREGIRAFLNKERPKYTGAIS
jgi:enoyl-CoA hydratase/carnithine racemase